MRTTVWSNVIGCGCIGITLVALLGTLRFEASSNVVTSPVIADRVWRFEESTAPRVGYRSWREMIGEPSPSSCESRQLGGSIHHSESSTTCRRTLGVLQLVDEQSSSGGYYGGSRSSRTLTLEGATTALGRCEVYQGYYDDNTPPPDQRSWSRSGDLLYAHDPRRDLHGYRWAGAATHWTLWFYGPNARVAKVWRARPWVPYARLAAALLLACATVVVVR